MTIGWYYDPALASRTRQPLRLSDDGTGWRLVATATDADAAVVFGGYLESRAFALAMVVRNRQVLL